MPIPTDVASVVDVPGDFRATPKPMRRRPNRTGGQIRHPPTDRAFVCSPVNVHIRDRPDPPGAVALQVRDPFNPPNPGAEVLPHVADRPLDLALGLSPVGTGCLGCEPMKRGKGGKARMPLDGAIGRRRNDHRGHVVRQDGGGGPAKRREGMLEARKNDVLADVGDELDIEAPGIAERVV